MTRYQPEHKQQTRRRLIESAVTAFRRDGVESAGLKQIMQEMGLTVGGFYRHFSSKSQLVQSAVALGLLQSLEQFRRTSDGNGLDDASAGCDGIGSIERFATAYLSERHRRSIAQGCVLAALGSDIARSDSDVKAVCEAGLRELHAELHRSCAGGTQRKTLGPDGPRARGPAPIADGGRRANGRGDPRLLPAHGESIARRAADPTRYASSKTETASRKRCSEVKVAAGNLRGSYLEELPFLQRCSNSEPRPEPTPGHCVRFQPSDWPTPPA